MTALQDVRNQIKRDLVIQGTVKDADIDDCIRSAIRMQHKNRYVFSRRLATLQLNQGAASVTLPTDYNQLESVSLIDGDCRYDEDTGFTFVEFIQLKQRYKKHVNNSRRPVACAVLDGLLYFDCEANKSYTLELLYYYKDVSLPMTDSATSVFFNDEYYDVIRSSAKYLFEKEKQNNPKADPSVARDFAQALDLYHLNTLRTIGY